MVSSFFKVKFSISNPIFFRFNLNSSYLNGIALEEKEKIFYLKDFVFFISYITWTVVLVGLSFDEK